MLDHLGVHAALPGLTTAMNRHADPRQSRHLPQWPACKPASADFPPLFFPEDTATFLP